MKTNIILFFALLLLSLNLVSAEYDWSTYGNFPSSFNMQYSNAFGKFNTGIYNVTINNGFKYGNGTVWYNNSFQPIVSNFGINGTSEYFFVVNNNYLQAYDQYLNLIQEIYTGVNEGQIDSMDFMNNGGSYDIVGVFNVNPTLISFRVYSYNTTTLTFSLGYEQNFTVGSSHFVSGVKHSNHQAYFVYAYDKVGTNYENNLTSINKTSFIQSQLPNDTYPYIEPVMIQDIDGDGKTDFTTYSRNKVISVNEDGTIISSISATGGSSSDFIKSARIYRPDSTSVWKIAILETQSTGQGLQVKVVRPSGLSYWTQTLSLVGGSTAFGDMAVTDDFDGDGHQDLYVVSLESKFGTIYTNYLRFFVLNGLDGTNLSNKYFNNVSNWRAKGFDWQDSLTIANLNSDSKKEFIYNLEDGVFIYDIADDIIYINKSASTSGSTTGYFYSCIPADINRDGFNEVICSGVDKTIIYSSTYINQNANLYQLILDPSTNIIIGQTLTIFANANDNESDFIYYSRQCSNGEGYSTESYSSTLTCSYNSSGIYNLTVRARDIYHSTYSQLSALITVTTTGISCNNNGICESGESFSNCPNDCSSSTQNQTVQVNADSLSLPTELVSSSDSNQGLLPEIYFGLLSFFSASGVPFIIIIFCIFAVLIVMTIFTIIVKLVKTPFSRR